MYSVDPLAGMKMSLETKRIAMGFVVAAMLLLLVLLFKKEPSSTPVGLPVPALKRSPQLGAPVKMPTPVPTRNMKKPQGPMQGPMKPQGPMQGPMKPQGPMQGPMKPQTPMKPHDMPMLQQSSMESSMEVQAFGADAFQRI
jgi:hypothetical protein